MTTYCARLLVALPLLAPMVADADDADEEISEITVAAKRIANDVPASTYASVATSLRFDPLTELQSRGLAEGQSDVTVRGGLFENTGFKLGAVTIVDPQTGHYVAELPVDPAWLAAPQILKGVDSAVAGFNSTIATVAYGLRRVDNSGHVSIGAGSDGQNSQALRFSRRFDSGNDADWGFSLSAARSEGDGTVEFGDHEFSRFNVQLQRATAASQSDLVLAYQDKFYGWPGAYTGFATLPEIDDTQTTLLLLNHRQDLQTGWFEVGAFYRRLEDDYDFNRTTLESGTPGSFEHETKVSGIGLQGSHPRGRIDWRYSAQLTSDELVRSTDLTSGSFDDRRYVTLSLVPTIDVPLQSGDLLTWRLGASWDYSNRDGGTVSPLVGVALQKSSGSASTTYELEYAETTQLPGYTVLKSNPAGLFGGNASLGRESAQQLAVSVTHDTGDWQVQATLFSRRDDDLVDWTYATGAPFARQANAVDIDVIGLEAVFTRRWYAVDLALGYTALDKDADYGSAVVDASYYALNFAKHRLTAALTWRFADAFELRVDNEYRSQEDNPLRVGDDAAFLASASVRWDATAWPGFGLALLVDNVTDSEYQPFPGTPASGRQFSLRASYGW